MIEKLKVVIKGRLIRVSAILLSLVIAVFTYQACGPALSVKDQYPQSILSSSDARFTGSLTNRYSLSSSFSAPASRQGASEARLSSPDQELEQRYSNLREMGVGYRQYNYYWSNFESAIASSDQPISCPQGTRLVPANQEEKARLGFHRYHCYNLATIAEFDRIFALDAKNGMQTGIVVWSSPPMYQYPNCEGFIFGAVRLKEGCAPRDDAMNDFSDFFTFTASRYNGTSHGKVSHYIIWNENASDGWFDYSPVAPKNDLSRANVERRIDKYAAMMRAAHDAIDPHTSSALIYASTDMLWDAGLHPGHMGTKTLLDGLWARLGLGISWSVAVHPYGDPGSPTPSGHYNFQNLEMVANYQREQLLASGVTNPEAYPQQYLIASEQGWGLENGGRRGQARFICLAHAKVSSMPSMVAVAHNYFHSVEPNENDPAAVSGQGSFFGLIPHRIPGSLNGYKSTETGLAFLATSPKEWGQNNSNYCCQNHSVGCSGAVDVAPPLIKDYAVMGVVDRIVSENSKLILKGWACARSNSTSIPVHIYAGGVAGSGTMIGSTVANQTSEPNVNEACGTTQGKFRFSFEISDAVRASHSDQHLYVYGISPYGNGNPLLEGSGLHLIPKKTIATQSSRVVSKAAVPVYRYRRADLAAHFFTTSPTEVSAKRAFIAEGVGFKLFASSDSLSAPVYRCSLSTGRQMLSLSSNCEGQTVEGQLGYVRSALSSESPKTLYRCFRPSSGHLFTTNSAECRLGQYTIESVMGYVP